MPLGKYYDIEGIWYKEAYTKFPLVPITINQLQRMLPMKWSFFY